MEYFWKDFFTDKEESSDPQVKLLKNNPLFKDLKDDLYPELTDLLHERNYEKEESIFSRGDPASAMFLIQEGSVCIFRSDPTLGRQNLASLAEDEFFGELAISSEHRRNASAEALEATKLQVIFREEFLDFARRNLEQGFVILRNLARVTGERLRKVNEDFYKLKLKYSKSEQNNAIG